MSRLPTSTMSPMRNPLGRSVEARGRSDAILFERMSLATMYQRNLRKASTFETTVSFVPGVAMRSMQRCEKTVSRGLHSNSHVPAYCTCNIANCHRRYRASCSFLIRQFCMAQPIMGREKLWEGDLSEYVSLSKGLRQHCISFIAHHLSFVTSASIATS